MNITSSNPVIKELHNLIDHSCKLQIEQQDDISSFQRAIIKKFFKAENVVIDRDNDNIILDICVDTNSNKTTYIDLDVNSSNLNSFLKSCVEENHASLRFYKNLLAYYHTAEPISA